MPSDRISTGIPGLDEILFGGLIPARAYLIRGGPGTGKTTMGLHFLAAGLADNNAGLFISFAETEQRVRADAKSAGISVEGMSFLDLTPDAAAFAEAQAYDIFSPGEVEREPMTREITQRIEQAKPRRIFVDGFGQMRHMATDSFHFRRLVQAFFRLVTERGATLVVANDAETGSDYVLESAADGAIHLEFTRRGRMLGVTKFRGSDFHAGLHPMRLTSSGVQVLPNAA